eukprot:scaffold520_cov300-Pavlova_lutheri.AAC.2
MTRTYLIRDGNVQPGFDLKTTRGERGQDYEFRDDRIRISFTRPTHEIPSGGIAGHVTMGFRDVDVTDHDRAVIRWSHDGDSNTSQDYSFFAVNDRPHGDDHDPLEAIRRGSARRDQQRREGTYEGSTQTPELSASLMHRHEQFRNRSDSLTVSSFTGNHAIGFGAQISTDNTDPIAFHVDVFDVYLDREGSSSPGKDGSSSPGIEEGSSSPGIMDRFYWNFLDYEDDDFFDLQNGALYVYGGGLLLVVILLVVLLKGKGGGGAPVYM